MGFKSFDQNWPHVDVCTITDHNYKNVYGWLRPKIKESEIETLEKEIKALREQISALEDHSKFWQDALKLFGLPIDSKWRAFKGAVNHQSKELKDLVKEVRRLEKMITTNTTPLDASKDGRYVYSVKDMILEIMKRVGR
jgi:hypothetical protein